MNVKPIGDRVIVTSRGIKEENCEIVVPNQFLENSNVCTTEDGQTVICRHETGYVLDDKRKIVEHADIIASIDDGLICPNFDWVHVRKCIDAEDESGIITSITKNSSNFAEILRAGPDSGINQYRGWLAYVSEINYNIQKVEETEADWLIKASSIEMIIDPEENNE